MARSLRSEFEGAWYHVMARGNQRGAIFEDDEDRESMLKTLGEACGRTGWEVHAWVLMGNHFHFIIYTPKANLVVGMQWFMNAYTRRFNCRHRRWGRLFGDRYKSLVIEPPEHGGESEYLRSVMWYVHLNPVRARLVRRSQEKGWQFERHRWSSLVQTYMVPPKTRLPWSKVEMGLGMEHLPDTVAGRRKFLLEANRRAEEWKKEERLSKGRGVAFSTESAGWYRGGEGFRDWLLERFEKKPVQAARNVRSGAQARDHSVQRAEQLVRIGLECFEWEEAEMLKAKGGDPRRLMIAEAIWKQTTVGQSWIAERLGMQSAGNVSQQLRKGMERAREKIPKGKMKKWEKMSRFVT